MARASIMLVTFAQQITSTRPKVRINGENIARIFGSSGSAVAFDTRTACAACSLGGSDSVRWLMVTVRAAFARSCEIAGRSRPTSCNTAGRSAANGFACGTSRPAMVTGM